MRINMIYFSGTGHTEAMAEALIEAIEEAGHELEVFTEEADEEFADADILIFGSPACGTEEVDDTIIQPTIANIDLEDKKVYMFGSYGWGGGEYMDTWREEMEEAGAELIADPIVCLEDPDDEVLDQLREVVDSI